MASKAEIRLQIVTALDAAGIKATQQQIDQMASSVVASNRKMGASANEVAASLGRMRGPAGKLQSAIGGMGGAFGKAAGQVGMVVAAWEAGWAVGTKINEGIQKIRREVFGYVSEAEKALKINREIAKERAKSTAAYEAAIKQQRDMAALEEERAKISLANIKAEADGYRAAARAKFEYLSAGMDAETQRLEREKFEDILTLQANGYDSTAIQQVEAIYDVMKAELDVRRQMEKVEAQETEELVKQKQLREQLNAAAEKEDRATNWKFNVQKRISDLENWEFADAELVDTKERNRRLLAARKELPAAELAVQRAGSEYMKIKRQLDATGNLSETQALRRATAMDAAYLARDRAAMAYDQATAGGDALGLQFSEGYIKQLNESSVQSYRALQEIQRNTANFDKLLNELLMVKGG